MPTPIYVIAHGEPYENDYGVSLIHDVAPEFGYFTSIEKAQEVVDRLNAERRAEYNAHEQERLDYRYESEKRDFDEHIALRAAGLRHDIRPEPMRKIADCQYIFYKVVTI